MLHLFMQITFCFANNEDDRKRFKPSGGASLINSFNKHQKWHTHWVNRAEKAPSSAGEFWMGSAQKTGALARFSRYLMTGYRFWARFWWICFLEQRTVNVFWLYKLVQINAFWEQLSERVDSIQFWKLAPSLVTTVLNPPAFSIEGQKHTAESI